MKILDKVKKNKKIIIIFVVTIFLLLILVGYLIYNMFDISDAERFEKEYEDLNTKLTGDEREYPYVDIPSDNKIKYADVSEILSLFEDKKDAVVYLGYPACLYCRSMVSLLCGTSMDSDIDKVYYLDLSERMPKYDKLLNILDDKLLLVDHGVRSVDVPVVLFLVDGNVVSYNKGTIISHKDPYIEMTEGQKEGLKKIYTDGIQDVLDGMQNNLEIVQS